MSSAPVDERPVPVDIQGARISTVVVQRVPADRVQRFLECQSGLTRAAEGFPGYKGTELYPPADDRNPEWVAVIHFNDQESLRRWIDSPIRSEWISKLHADIGEFRLKTLPTGFGAWFAGLVTGPEGAPPPPWKMAMTVLLGLYPTVMLLALLVGPYLNPLGRAASMLIGNALSVVILQWVVMPPLTNALGPWLRANAAEKRAFSLGGIVLIGLLLGGLLVLFRLATR
jgi:antibiotic biosynthesis monooxygenase (ABM) superfamily enzyme